MQLAPSILSADFLNLERDVALVADADVAPDWLHIDVMDGHFVPNLTIGPAFVRALKRVTGIPLDVHLMINNPAEQLSWYLDAGADLLTVHLECAEPDALALGPGRSAVLESLTEAGAERLRAMLERIRQAGCLAGIAVNPDTNISMLAQLAGCFDVAMVMCVHPGFGGQGLIASCLGKVAELARMRDGLGQVAPAASPHAPAGRADQPKAPPENGRAAASGESACQGAPGRALSPKAPPENGRAAASSESACQVAPGRALSPKAPLENGRAAASSDAALPVAFDAPGFLIEVDGGINAATAADAVGAGADILVAGSAVFAADDPLAAMAALREAASA